MFGRIKAKSPWTSTAVAARAAVDHSMRPSQMSMNGSFLRPRECLLHFLMRVFLLHLAALFDSLTWQLLAVVLKTEGVSIMPCVHIFLSGQSTCKIDQFFC